jgi:hypothetical protein
VISRWLFIIGIALTSHARTQSAPEDVSELVRQLGRFPAAISPGVQGNTGRPLPAEQQREALFIKLRALGASAVPALRLGLADSDVQIRRNVALYLGWEGGNYARHAPQPLDLKPFLSQLVIALRDDDERVKALSAQALAHIGADAVSAVPDLVRLLASPSEGVRNSACIGLAGIGPVAKDALPALRRALDDSSKDVRQFAQRAIDKIRGSAHLSETREGAPSAAFSSSTTSSPSPGAVQPPSRTFNFDAGRTTCMRRSSTSAPCSSAKSPAPTARSGTS